MRKAVVNKTSAVVLANSKPARICTYEGCTKELAAGKKKFCGPLHRNLFLKSGKNGGGKPPTYPYKKEYAKEKFAEYLAKCEEGNEPNLVPTESSFIVINKAILPTKEHYAEFLEVSLDTLDYWITVHTDFAIAMERMSHIQRSFLINNGLAGRYNPLITKLMLGVNHGIVEKKQVDNTHKHIGIIKHLYEKADEIERKQYGL